MSTGAPPVTFAELQIPADPSAAVTFDIEAHALKVALVSRESLKALDPKVWNKPGIYVLLGPLGGSVIQVYVGKSGGGKQGVRGRLLTHNSNPTTNAKFGWWRAVAVVRDTTEGFDSAQIGYLEGRLASELKALPAMKVRSDRGDLDTSLSEVKRLTLDSFVPGILAALKVSGLPLREEEPEELVLKQKKQSFGVTLPDLVAAGAVEVGAVFSFGRKGKVATATVTPQGELLVAGVAYKTPSEAGKAAHDLKNRPRGWTDWRLDGGKGASLHDVRKSYLEKLTSDTP